MDASELIRKICEVEAAVWNKTIIKLSRTGIDEQAIERCAFSISYGTDGLLRATLFRDGAERFETEWNCKTIERAAIRLANIAVRKYHREHPDLTEGLISMRDALASSLGLDDNGDRKQDGNGIQHR